MVFLEKIAKWIVVGGVLFLSLSPFFVSPETAFPAVFMRVIITRVVIEIMLVAYLFLALFFPQYRPKRSVIAYAVGAFILAFLLSTIFGINAYRAMWGSHERMEGFVTLLHFGGLFLALFGTFQKPEEFKKVLWASVVVSVGQIFYAFGQLPAFDIKGTKLYANDTSRISGTFGNATIFALYLDFQIFFAVMLFFWEKRTWVRWILAGIFVLTLIAIFLSGTRGSMIGVAAGAIVIALGYILFSGIPKLRIAGAACIAFIIGVFTLLYVFNDSAFVQDHYLLQRLSVFTSAGSTITSRSVAWQIGVKGWKDRFWFGYGMDNFNYVFNHYYEPRMLLLDSGDFDRPHNRFVDSLVTGGFFGLMTHLAIFAAAGWFLFKKWLRNKSFFFPLAAIALLIAYPMHIFTLFDHMISYQFFAIFLAMIAVWQVSANDKRQTTDDQQPKPGISDRNNDEIQVAMNYAPIKSAIFVVMTVVMGWFMWIANIVPAEASYWAQVASNTNYSSQGKEFRKAIEALRRSFDLDTYLNVDMRLALSGFATSQARNAQDEEGKKFGREVLEYMAGQFEKNLTEHHPDIKDFLAHQTYARIAQSLAEYDPAWNDKALKSLEQAVEEYPTKYQLAQALSRAYIQMGRAEDAAALFDRHDINIAKPDYFFDIAATYYTVGRNDDAWVKVEKAMDTAYDFAKNLSKLVDILLKDKRYDRIIKLYEYQLSGGKVIDMNVMASLAETYRQTGDIANARRVAEKLLELDPEHREETQAFLEELENK